MQADTHKPGSYTLAALPVVETYRGQAIRRSQSAGCVRYHAMGCTEPTLAMARARIEIEQGQANLRDAYEAYKAERDGRKKVGARLPDAEAAA